MIVAFLTFEALKEALEVGGGRKMHPAGNQQQQGWDHRHQQQAGESCKGFLVEDIGVFEELVALIMQKDGQNRSP